MWNNKKNVTHNKLRVAIKHSYPNNGGLAPSTFQLQIFTGINANYN